MVSFVKQSLAQTYSPHFLNAHLQSYQGFVISKTTWLVLFFPANVLSCSKVLKGTEVFFSVSQKQTMFLWSLKMAAAKPGRAIHCLSLSNYGCQHFVSEKILSTSQQESFFSLSNLRYSRFAVFYTWDTRNLARKNRAKFSRGAQFTGTVMKLYYVIKRQESSIRRRAHTIHLRCPNLHPGFYRKRSSWEPRPPYFLTCDSLAQ